MSFGKGFGQPGKLPSEGKAGAAPARNFVVPKKKRGPILIKKNEAAIADLCQSLDKQPKFGKMVIYSVGVFEKLAVDETSAEEIIESGAIETMMKVLEANPDNEQIHAAINRCLKTLAKNDRLAALIAKRMKGRLNPLAHSLKNHIEPETLIAGCGTVHKLTKGKETKEVVDEMFRAGIVDALCGLVVKHHGNHEVMTAATEALQRFGEFGQIAPQILHSGAPEKIIKAMRDHPEDLTLVKAGAALIAGLCKNGGPGAVDLLKKLGAVDCLVNALEAHPYNDELVGYASEALKHLTGVNDMGLALAPVISGDVRLDAKTAAALSRIAALALVDSNIAYMHKNHGIDWLVGILKNAVGTKGAIASKILANGLRVLQRANNDENKVYDFMKKGGVQLLTSILSGHMDDEKVAEGALTALAGMVTRKENAIYIGNKGGIEMATKCVAAHPKSETIARAALDLFGAMAAFPETGQMMVDKGAIKTLMDILSNHMDNPEICNSAIQTLGKLATSEPAVNQMIEQGMLPRLVDVLKKHPNNPEVCKNAMMAMDTALLVPKSAGQLKKLGAPDAIAAVMDMNPDDAEIQELGQHLQDTINGGEEKRKADEAAKKAADEAEKMRIVEAERAKAAEAEQARLKAIQDERDRIDRIRREKEQAEQRAQMARIQEEQARKMEQEALEAEMASALAAMKASESAAKIKMMQENEAKKQEEDRARLAADMEAARLKNLEEQRRLEEIEKRRREIEKMRLDLAKKDEDPEQRKVFSLIGQRPELQEKEKKDKLKLKKSAREIFDADEEKDKKLAILPVPIKNFLLAGQLLVKHSKTSLPRPRHLYLSHDIEYLIWKDPQKLEIDLTQRMRIYKLYGVNAGRCTPQLQRKRFGKYLVANEDCAFSIYGADLYEEERTVDFEAPNPEEAKTWVHALEVLIEYSKNRMMYGQKQAAMRSDKELRKLGHRLDGHESDEEDPTVVMAEVSGIHVGK